jgi:type IV secretion system protein VirB9
MKRLLVSAAMCAALGAHAVEVPRSGSQDFRVRTADYNEDQVYKITGFFGFHALVVFGPDEKIQKIGAFDKGWKVDDLGNKIMISPKVEDADANLTVVTTRRIYHFDLAVKPFPKGKYRSQAEDTEQTYSLRFRYPDDEAFAAAARAMADRAERRLREAASAANNKPRNYNYTYMGSDAIRPYEVWDDGTFTYFKFYAQQDLPSVFVINDDGTESVVNKGMERDGDTLVVQRVGKQFVLRMGNSVTCIYNETPVVYTPSTGTETSSDRLQRVIKGDTK